MEEIKILFERKTALQELFSSLDNVSKEKGDELYEKIVADLTRTNSLFQAWWFEKGLKYDWKNIDTGQWNIDFKSYDVFLMIVVGVGVLVPVVVLDHALVVPAVAKVLVMVIVPVLGSKMLKNK
jgi:CXXX repeat modification system protein